MAERPPTPPGRIAWHELSARDAAARLGSDPQRGLTAAEAERRLAEHGRNEPPQDEREPWWQEAFEALTEPLVLLLVAVGVLYALLGRVEDAITIFFVIVAFSTIETATEARAKRAIRSLAELAAPEATVLRDAEPGVVPAWALVPGDVVLLDAGRRVPADVRLLSATALLIDESTLTGESAPAAKLATEILAADTPLGDRVNLAFAGTMVTAGNGRGLVAETGAATELGRVAALARSATEPRTPLQRYLAQLAGWLLWLALGFSALIPLLDMALLGRPWRESVLEGLTLAFATIPEELPILVTIMLGLGAVRLARQHAITRHLAAAETLGSVTVVCTDKTGTLTENRMQVAEVFIGGTRRPLAGVLDEPSVRRLLTVGVLANGAQATEAEDGSPRFIGDPTDVALLAAAHDADVLGARQEVAILAEVPFDDRRRRVSALYERAGERRLAVKGAPEQVLECCERALADGAEALLDAILRAKILHAARQLAAKGERVIAFADGRLTAPADFSGSSSERLPFGDSGLTLIGLAGLEDPPRPEARGTVETLGRAGVRVVMLTGDHPATACTIAERVGLSGRAFVTGGELDVMQPAELRDALGRADVFARIAPEHKLRVVEILQEDGEVVAVTGDGINDAPALRRAAIGIAMGRKGPTWPVRRRTSC
jgi:Ca2+-transporting ATPase